MENAIELDGWTLSSAEHRLALSKRLASNWHEDHEVSMLALHLLQNCLVYINTLMIQQILSRPQWDRRLTASITER